MACHCGRGPKRPGQKNCLACNREAQRRSYRRRRGIEPPLPMKQGRRRDRLRRRLREMRAVLLAVPLAAHLVSCTQPPRKHQLGFEMPPVVAAEDALGTSRMQRAFASLLAGGQQQVYGNVREIYARTACQPAVPASNPVPGSYNRPVVGQEFVLKWHVEVLNPRPRAVALLCSTQPPPAPAPLDPFGAPGCVLLVRPDFVVVPQQSTTGLLTYSPASGVVTLRWTPEPHMLGQRLTAQILVAVPGANQAGHLVGPAVEIIVGNQ